jgi:hypothetical protein
MLDGGEYKLARKSKGVAELIGGIILASVTLVFLLLIMQYFTVRYNYYNAHLPRGEENTYIYVVDSIEIYDPDNNNYTLHVLLKGEGVVNEVYAGRSIVYINDTGLEVVGSYDLAIPLDDYIPPGTLLKVVYNGGGSFGVISEVVEGYVDAGS